MNRSVRAAGWTVLTAVTGIAFAADTSPTVEPSPERLLTLEESIDLAFRNHGTVLLAQEQLVGAKQRVIVARSPLLPQIEQNSTYQSLDQTRKQQVGTTVQFTGSFAQVSHQHSLLVSQKLWDSGETSAQVRQSKAGVRSADAGVRLARDSVAFEVASAYFEQLRSEKLLALTKQQVEQSQKHLDQVQAQVDAGVSARIDLQPVRVELRQAQFNLVSAENGDRIAATKFRNALGLARGPRLRLQEVAESAPTSVGSLEDCLAEARRFRADLQQAQANVVQSEASYDLARIQARPLVTVTSNYNLGLFDSPLENQWTLNGALTIPLFDAGALRAQVRDARSTVEADRIQLRQLEKDVTADVESAYATLLSAVDSIGAARTLVEEARENLAAASEKYRLGLGLVIETVDAQVQLFNAETSATQALYDYYIARAGLDRAVGRWAREGKR